MEKSVLSVQSRAPRDLCQSKIKFVNALRSPCKFGAPRVFCIIRMARHSPPQSMLLGPLLERAINLNKFDTLIMVAPLFGSTLHCRFETFAATLQSTTLIIYCIQIVFLILFIYRALELKLQRTCKVITQPCAEDLEAQFYALVESFSFKLEILFKYIMH